MSNCFCLYAAEPFFNLMTAGKREEEDWKETRLTNTSGWENYIVKFRKVGAVRIDLEEVAFSVFLSSQPGCGCVCACVRGELQPIRGTSSTPAKNLIFILS